MILSKRNFKLTTAVFKLGALKTSDIRTRRQDRLYFKGLKILDFGEIMTRRLKYMADF